MLRFLSAALLAAAGAATALAADRAKAAVDCKPAGDKFAYDCVIKLSNARSAAPIEKAEVTVGADMPSMPMAHNIKPVKAEATGKAGEYKFRIALDMHGEWALKIRLAKPRQDLIVHKMTFAKSPN